MFVKGSEDEDSSFVLSSKSRDFLARNSRNQSLLVESGIHVEDLPLVVSDREAS